MAHEVFILGGQRIDQREKRDGREARENKERKERIENGSGEGIEEETKRQFEEKEVPERDPYLVEFLDPTLQCSYCFFKASGWS